MTCVTEESGGEPSRGRSAAAGSTAAPTLKGTKRGGGIPGTQDSSVEAGVCDGGRSFAARDVSQGREREENYLSLPLPPLFQPLHSVSRWPH